MPGTDAPNRAAQLDQIQSAGPKTLYAVDGRLTAASPVTDPVALAGLAAGTVTRRGGHVLDTSHVTFPNGAITLVLILAESHLSIHTWPEEQLIAVDLFSCGAIDGRAIVCELASQLALDEISVRTIDRGFAPAHPGAGAR